MARRWGFIDKTGKMVISPQFEDVHSFVKGLAPARLGKTWGFIDTAGKFAINPQFEDAAGFSEGLAGVRTGGRWGSSPVCQVTATSLLPESCSSPSG